MEAAAKQAIDRLGVDVLIANAGFAGCSAISKADDNHFRRLMEVNYFGQVNTVRPFLPHFAAQKRGDIVLVASTLAIFSVWGYGAYSASKFALRGFAEALRQEMLLDNVRVKLFLPPTTDTPGLERENQDKPPIIHEMEMASSLNKTHPVDKVVSALLDWIPKKKFVGYATFDTWFQYFAARHFPNLALKIADGEMYKAIKRLEDKAGEIKARA
jgi:short-subunit dehydrogenase